jgi:TATA-box binding protein (TBP) (component of TFIID and TFIIIB)
MVEYSVTNVVIKCEFITGRRLDLRELANTLTNAIYNPRQFSALRWRDRRIGGSLLLFGNGYAICHGKASSMFEARQRVRRYARRVQKAGYPDVRIASTKLITLTMAANLGSRVDLPKVVGSLPSATYEPELHNALMMRTGHAHYNVFGSGRVIVTGVLKFGHIHSKVLPTLIEISLS